MRPVASARLRLTWESCACVVPVGYVAVAVELLADNAAREAEAVYAALGMPFSALVFGLRQYYSQASVDIGKKLGA
jgi:hypothetical protein